MLHARKARVHSAAGDAYHALDDAIAAYDQAGPFGEDLPAMCRLTHGELQLVAASSASSPSRAESRSLLRASTSAAVVAVRTASAWERMG